MTECNICSKEYDDEDLIVGYGIRREIESLIETDFPDWTDESKICREDYKRYREKYVLGLIEGETASIRELQADVVKSIKEHEIISENSNLVADEVLKLGERVSDKVASFGGSWKFIIIFFMVLAGWIIVNSALYLMKPFDPYPFILMNLILSCLAAIQAPIIMMSQNRQEKKDRLRSESDYKVNLKSEIEVRTLHEKVDHLLFDQWSKMVELQEMQLEILEEIKRDLSKT